MGNGDAAKCRANEAYDLANTANGKADSNSAAIATITGTSLVAIGASITNLSYNMIILIFYLFFDLTKFS